MKKVLHLLQSSKFSGAENVVCQTINHFQGRIEMVYCSQGGKIEEVLKNKNIKFIKLESISIKEIRRVIMEYKPDIIHAHDYTMSIKASLCTNLPIISHLHHNPSWLKRINLKSLAYAISSFKFYNVLCVSNSIYDEYILKKIIKNKIIIMPNPVDVIDVRNKYQVKKIEEQIDIIFVGRLADAKNPLKFISIIYDVKKVFPRIKVIMMGEGDLFDACNKEIKVLGLEENISLLSFQENPYQYIGNSKVLIMTSKWEGFGLVAFEALALGVPVIASDVGGLKGIVNEKCGKLCNTKNNEEFVEEVIKLIDSEKYRLNKSKHALIQANKLHNVEQYIDKMNEIYDIRKE